MAGGFQSRYRLPNVYQVTGWLNPHVDARYAWYTFLLQNDAVYSLPPPLQRILMPEPWAWYIDKVYASSRERNVAIFHFVKNYPMLQAAINDDPDCGFKMMYSMTEFKRVVRWYT